MVGLKTGMPRCASGSSSGWSHGRASEFGDGRWAPSEPKKWSGWTVIAGAGGVTDLDGVSEEVRLLDIAGGLPRGDGDKGGRRRRERGDRGLSSSWSSSATVTASVRLALCDLVVGHQAKVPLSFPSAIPDEDYATTS